MLLEPPKKTQTDRLLIIGLFVCIALAHGLLISMALHGFLKVQDKKAVQLSPKQGVTSQVYLVQRQVAPMPIKEPKAMKPTPKPEIEPKPESKFKPEPVEKNTQRSPKIAAQKTVTKSKPTQTEKPISTTASVSPKSVQSIVTLPSTKATASNNTPPQYPKLSRRLKEKGIVQLQLTVKRDGRVAEISVHTSSGYKRLDEAALKAVQSWRYEPATKDGLPIDYVYLQPIEFALQ